MNRNIQAKINMRGKNDFKIKNLNIEPDRSKKPKFLGMADNLLLGLNERSKDIIRKRFGLSSDRPETLEKIGRQYGITRERVRQIISETLKSISKKLNSDKFLEAEEKIIFTIQSNDGIIKESEIISKFNSDGQKEANAIKFFANCSKKIFEIGEKGVIERAWVLSKDTLKNVKEVIENAQEVIQFKKVLLNDQEIFEELKKRGLEISKSQIVNFLSVSSKIQINKFGKWGMSDWDEVNPKGTREKVYLVLKEHKKPLHFTEIAALIDKFNFGKRKAHPQTVHNELIKDNRFVLIGRGIYALQEWGYSKGTIREIIQKILSESDRPISKEEIMEQILKMRKVKKATIMINLNNRNFFIKKGELYSVKK